MKTKKKRFMSVLLTMAVMLGLMLASTAVANAEAAPTTISDISDWESFADAVNGGHSYENETVTLMNSISLPANAKMAGTSNTRFKGTFEGNGHKITVNYDVTEDVAAPFRYVGGATFKNLIVDGTIKSSASKAAGFVGNVAGDTSFISCASGVNIESTKSGDATDGGFCGNYDGLGQVSFVDCLFYGSISGETTENCGGFYGWPTSGNVSFQNCLNVGEFNTKKNESEEFVGCGTFVRVANPDNITIENCYYRTAYGLKQGQEIGDMNAIELREKLGDGWVINNSCVIPKFVALQISSKDDWDAFADSVNDGNSFEGKAVLLTEDIAVTKMVGDDSHPFKGTFIGGGHMITFNCAASEAYAAPFRYVDGATFVDLRASGKIETSHQYAAGFVAHSKGNVLFDSCYSSIDIESSVKGDGTHAGFLAYAVNGEGTTDAVVFASCLFNGSISGEETNHCGGFLGWPSHGTAYFENCLNVGEFSTDTEGCGTFSRVHEENKVIVNNCFYQTAYGLVQGTSTADMTLSDLRDKLGENKWKANEVEVIPNAFKYDATVIKAPVATPLIYTGAAQKLLDVSDVEVVGGQMLYARGSATEATEAYSQDVPEETEAGTYYVWYYVKAVDGYYDTDAVCLKVNIDVADKTELRKAIEDAEAYYASIKDDARYSDIAEKVRKAIDDAQAVVDDAKADTADVSDATATINDVKDAAEVEVLIKLLPDPSSVATTDKENINAARVAYDALTADQKALVSEAYYTRLTADEAVLAAVVRAGEAEKAAAEAAAAKKAAEDKAAAAEKNEFKPLAKAKITKVTGGKSKATVKWNKVSGATGYEILIAKNKKGTVSPKTYTVKSTKKVIKKLAKGNYYVKVRAYKTLKGNTVYGKFSAAKKAKVK